MLAAMLEAVELDRMSPREALALLYRMRARLDDPDSAPHDVSVAEGGNALG